MKKSYYLVYQIVLEPAYQNILDRMFYAGDEMNTVVGIAKAEHYCFEDAWKKHRIQLTNTSKSPFDVMLMTIQPLLDGQAG